MRELLEKTLSMNELDIRKHLRTAAVGGLIGATAAGFGYRKGLSQREVEKPVEKPISITKVEHPVELQIDIQKIAKIESSNNPNAVNKRTGARGLCQIMHLTWEEMVSKMGVDWSWEKAFDEEANKEVANYYMNIEIPRLLKYYGLDDTVENRLAAYNWGPGNLSRKGFENAPQETIDYIERYKSL